MRKLRRGSLLPRPRIGQIHAPVSGQSRRPTGSSQIFSEWEVAGTRFFLLDLSGNFLFSSGNTFTQIELGAHE
jgi:hypothetical protein